MVGTPGMEIHWSQTLKFWIWHSRSKQSFPVILGNNQLFDTQVRGETKSRDTLGFFIKKTHFEQFHGPVVCEWGGMGTQSKGIKEFVNWLKKLGFLTDLTPVGPASYLFCVVSEARKRWRGSPISWILIQTLRNILSTSQLTIPIGDHGRNHSFSTDTFFPLNVSWI